MRKLLIAALLGLLPSLAWADSKVSALSAGTSLTGSLLYLDQGPGADRKLGFDTASFCIAAGNLALCSPLTLTSPSLVTPSIAGGALSGTFSGNPTFSGSAPLFTGLSAGTQVSCLGLDSGNHLVLNAAACGSGGGTVTWPASTDLVISNGTNSPAGLAPVNGDCVIGSGGAWTAGACSSGGTVSVTAGTPNLVITPTPGLTTFTVGSTNAQNSPADAGSHSYTALASDLAKEVVLVNTFTGLAVPQATGSFAAGASFSAVTQSAVTATSTTSTVNGIAGATGIKLGANQFSQWDALGGNWIVGLGLPQPATQTGTTFLRDDMTWVAPAITIASGTSALGTGAISSAACATVVTTSAPNTATTDVVTASFNGDPTGVTGYIPATAGMLTIFSYPTSGNVNFKVCNDTGSSITPGAITLNWRVVR